MSTKFILREEKKKLIQKIYLTKPGVSVIDTCGNSSEENDSFVNMGKIRKYLQGAPEDMLSFYPITNVVPGVC